MIYPSNRDMAIQRSCPTPGCKTKNVVMVHEGDYMKWRKRDKIQDAMPYLDADEREILITGICIDCWDKMKEE